MQVPRWRYWSNLHSVEPILPPALELPEAANQWALEHAGRVVLSPFSAYQSRTWPVEHWLALEDRLKRSALPAVILDDRPGRTDGFVSPKLIQESPARVAAVFNQSICFVGNDSGMAHVCGFLRRPGIAVCHPVSDRGIMALYPTIAAVQAPGLTVEGLAGLVESIVWRKM